MLRISQQSKHSILTRKESIASAKVLFQKESRLKQTRVSFQNAKLFCFLFADIFPLKEGFLKDSYHDQHVRKYKIPLPSKNSLIY